MPEAPDSGAAGSSFDLPALFRQNSKENDFFTIIMNNDDFLLDLERKLIAPQADLRSLSAEQQFSRIMDRVATIPNPVISPTDLLERLKASKASGKPLTIKFGIDPTGPEIHIGHSVSLIILRLFQRMGHKLSLVIGDFTGMIGDPSGRSDERPALTEEQVRKNMETYSQQAARIIDLKDPSIETSYNSEWMKALSVADWVKIIRHIPVGSLLQREDFSKRLSSGLGLSLAEMEYALFMAYDSTVLNPDIEIGGLDQYLNLHMCRQMMGICGQKPEIILACNLLPGTSGEKTEDGRFIKMSKSRGNYIPVNASPEDMYGKTMSIPDEIMWIWFRELTEIAPSELADLKARAASGDIHPKKIKHLLARVVVGIFNYFDAAAMQGAEKDFLGKFGEHASLAPANAVPVSFTGSESLVEILANVSGLSKNELRRLAKQNAIRIVRGEVSELLSEKQLQTPAEQFKECHLKVGKKGFFKITAEKGA